MLLYFVRNLGQAVYQVKSNFLLCNIFFFRCGSISRLEVWEQVREWSLSHSKKLSHLLELWSCFSLALLCNSLELSWVHSLQWLTCVQNWPGLAKCLSVYNVCTFCKILQILCISWFLYQFWSNAALAGEKKYFWAILCLGLLATHLSPLEQIII